MKNKSLIIIILSLFLAQAKAQKPELVLRFGNTTNVQKIGISPDGKTMASLDAEGMIVLWDIDLRKQKAYINGMQDEITEIVFSPDGKTLIGTGTKEFLGIGNKEKKSYLFFWDYHTAKLIHKKELENSVSEIQITPDHKKLMTYGKDFGIQIRNLNTGNIENTIKLGLLGLNRPEDVFISPDNKYVACATQNPLKGANQLDNVLSLLGGDDKDKEEIKRGFIQILDYNTGKAIKEIHVGTGKNMLDKPRTSLKINDIVITPDSRYIIASGTFDAGNLIVVNYATGKVVKYFDIDATILRVSPDAKYLFASIGWKIHKINLRNFYIEKSFDVPVPKKSQLVLSENEQQQGQTFDFSETGLWDIKFSSDGKYFVTCGGNEKHKTSHVDLWDYNADRKLSAFEAGIAEISAVDFLEANKNLIVGTKDGSIQLVDLTTGKLRQTLSVGQGELTAALSPDQKYIIGSFTNMNENIALGLLKWRRSQLTKIWDAQTLALVDSIPGHANTIISPDGKYLLTTQQLSMKTMWRLYELDGMKLILEKKMAMIPVQFSKSGTMILAKQESSFEIISTDKFKTLMKAQKVKGSLQMLKFSPDETRIIGALSNRFGSFGGQLREWDTNGKLIREYYKADDQKVLTADYSPDGKTVVAGFMNKNQTSTMRFFDVDEGSLKDSIENNGLPMLYTPNGNFLLAYGNELFKSLNFVDIANKKTLVSYVKVNNKNDGVLYTPDYYYFSTKNGHEAIAFSLNNNVYPFEQFDLQYNRPDIVCQRLPYTDPNLVKLYYHAYQKRLRKMGISEEKIKNDFQVPEAEILNYDQLPISSNSDRITLELQANEERYLLQSYNIWINDVSVFGSKGKDLSSQQIRDFSATEEIQLVNGTNKVQFSVLNANGIESNKVTKYIEYIGPAKPKDLYILSIGISEYVDTEYNLTFATKDANDFANAFKNKRGVFRNTYVKTITNSEATRDNILAAKPFVEKAKTDDMVMIFFAGHGLLSEDFDYYLSTHDVDFYNPAEMGLFIEDFEGLLDGINARRKIMFIDACHSGEVDKEEEMRIEAAIKASEEAETNQIADNSSDNDNMMVGFRGMKPTNPKRQQMQYTGLENLFELMQELFVDLRRGSGALIISAAGGGEFAYESAQWNNGVFTASILDGITNKKADLNTDGKIHISELRQFVGDNVRRLTRGHQNPTHRSENLEFDFLLAK